MSEDCQKCGTSMYDLDEEKLCPGCSNHETENETMTNKQTIDGVTRDLLEEAAEAFAAIGMFERLEEVRALLAKPAEQHQGEPVAHCFLRRNGEGEWINDAKSWADGLPCRDIVEMCEKNPELYQLRMAYAEQPAPVAFPGYPPVPEDRQLPAPVAVVLPEHKNAPPLSGDQYGYGWNACLDEVARLNPESKPCKT